MNIIDLTHEIKTGIMRYPGDPDISLTEALIHEKDYCHVDYLQCGSHTGTHIDAPYHFLPDGKRITDFPISKFVGEGIVIDLRYKEAGEVILPEDIEPYKHCIREGDFVLIQTGWYYRFGTDEYLDHPYFSKETAVFLAKMGISIIAVDFMNVDSTKLEQWQAHPVFLSNDVLIVENINHSLKLKPDIRYRFGFLPLKLHGSDGSPIRAFAIET
ncbi:MAG: cyclase family protein [Bacillota bacterium]|nr:cyclase family protein [Bacillota bacterium]